MHVNYPIPIFTFLGLKEIRTTEEFCVRTLGNFYLFVRCAI